MVFLDVEAGTGIFIELNVEARATVFVRRVVELDVEAGTGILDNLNIMTGAIAFISLNTVTGAAIIRGVCDAATRLDIF